jgi:PadR family transcriptional regulator, regulatory protein PadR
MANSTPGYDSDLLRGNTDSLLLFLINEHGQTYGYRLIQEIEERSRGYFRFKEGTVYPALRKLENDGLIQGEWKRLPNGQERRYYTMTEVGRELLRRKLLMWESFASAMALVMKPTES